MIHGDSYLSAADRTTFQRQVLYLGISDSPAWVASAANTYARAHGKTPFSIYQGRWNVMLRDIEHEIIPMALKFGMALAPWDVLGGGKLQSQKQVRNEHRWWHEAVHVGTDTATQPFRSRSARRTMRVFVACWATASKPKKRRSSQLSCTRSRRSTASSPSQLSPLPVCCSLQIEISSRANDFLAGVLCKYPYVFPLVGGRKIEHLHDNIKALEIKLTDEQIQKIESVKDFNPPFPSNFIGPDSSITGKTGGFLLPSMGTLDIVKAALPIGHA